jgi:hypothetical protein
LVGKADFRIIVPKGNDFGSVSEFPTIASGIVGSAAAAMSGKIRVATIRVASNTPKFANPPHDIQRPCGLSY